MQLTVSRFKRRSRTVALVGALAMAMAGPVLAQSAGVTVASSAGAPIRIGIVFPLTGGSSDSGNSALIGAQMAVQEINEVGGYLGRKLELVVRDDKGNPDEAVKVTNDLVVNEKVAATVGFCNTGNAMKVLDVFQTHKHVLMVSCATGTVLTAKYPAAESYVFRNTARDALQTQFLVNEIVKRGLKKPAMLADKTGYGDTGVKDMEEAMAKAGLKLHYLGRFDNGKKSLVDEVTQARDSGADALIAWTVGPDSGVMAASRAKIGWKVPHFGSWAMSFRTAHDASEGAIDGVMMPQTVLPNRFLERHNTFFARYAKLSKEPVIGSVMSAAQTYDAVNLLLRAIFQAKGDLSGPSIKNQLENLSRPYQGVVTTYDKPFSNKDHDAISLNMIWLGTWRDGQRVYFYDDDAKKASVIRRKES